MSSKAIIMIFTREERDSWPDGCKKCTFCRALKSVEEFSPELLGYLGRSTRCKDCRRRLQKPRIKTAEENLHRRAKVRAAKFDLPFEIAVSDIVIPSLCPVLGIPLEVAVGRMQDNSPSLDRIQPDLGYVPGNIAVISMKANRIKNNGSAAEIRKVADWLDTTPRPAPPTEVCLKHV